MDIVPTLDQSVVAKMGVQLSGLKCGYIELSPSAGAGKGGGLAGAMCVAGTMTAVSGAQPGGASVLGFNS